jgi:hypothetical protein
MTNQVQTIIQTQTQTAPVIPIHTITHDNLITALIARALRLDGRGDILYATYQTDMLGKGKLRAAAKSHFKNGIFHKVGVTMQVNYDYATKLENRTDGEETAKGGNTWQQAVIVNGKKTPLAVHKEDIEFSDGVNMSFIPGARVYMRYEPITQNQKDAGFGKNDYSKYVDSLGNGIAYSDVQPFFFDRKDESPVNHRTLALGNVTSIKLEGETYLVTR